MRNLSIRCGAGKTPGQELPLPRRSSVAMSFSWLFLGGMLSSRARLRFTNRGQHAVNSVRRSSLLQRTANYLLTVCLTPGGKPTRPISISEVADKLEEFADVFIPKTRILIQRYKDAQTWAEIDPEHPDAVRVREEIGRREFEEQLPVARLEVLLKDTQPSMTNEKLAEKDPEAADRGFAAVDEMEELEQECLRQSRRYHAIY
jgi:hypothetical protein